jgi:hypothetical protein
MFGFSLDTPAVSSYESTSLFVILSEAKDLLSPVLTTDPSVICQPEGGTRLPQDDDIRQPAPATVLANAPSYGHP